MDGIEIQTCSAFEIGYPAASTAAGSDHLMRVFLGVVFTETGIGATLDSYGCVVALADDGQAAKKGLKCGDRVTEINKLTLPFDGDQGEYRTALVNTLRSELISRPVTLCVLRLVDAEVPLLGTIGKPNWDYLAGKSTKKETAYELLLPPLPSLDTGNKVGASSKEDQSPSGSKSVKRTLSSGVEIITRGSRSKSNPSSAAPLSEPASKKSAPTTVSSETWQCQFKGRNWKTGKDAWYDVDPKANAVLLEAWERDDAKSVTYSLWDEYDYEVDFGSMLQTNRQTGTKRRLRWRSRTSSEAAPASRASAADASAADNRRRSLR